ncbi:MAG: hypothetical protein ACOX4M_05905 [Acetivibrionales bacterium]|jgi:hypothetical protein
MRNRYYVLFVIILIILGIGECAKTGQSPPVSSEMSLHPASPGTSAISAYYSVLQNKAPFFSIDAKKDINIAQLNLAVSSDSSVKAKVTKFAIVDLEKDDVPEVVLWLAVNGNDDFGFEVLRYHDGVVYGYTLPYRSFMDLKDDGTFSFSGGAADYGFGTVKFTEKGYAIDKISYSESGYDSSNNQIISYFVNRESAAKEDFLSAINKQSKKPAATWYDFTDDNIGDKMCR